MAASIGSVVTYDNTVDNIGSSTVTIPTPTHNAGDVLVYVIVRNSSSLSAAPTDVDLVTGGDTSLTPPTDWWYMRIGTGTNNEPASRTWTFTGTRTTAAACVVVQNALYPNGIQVTTGANYGNAGTIDTPSNNATDALVLASCIISPAAFPVDSRSNTPVASVVSGGTSQISGLDIQTVQLTSVGDIETLNWVFSGNGSFNLSMRAVVLQSAGSDTRPVITTSASAIVVAPGATVTLTAVASDPDVGDAIVSYAWAPATATADTNLLVFSNPSGTVTTVTMPSYEAAFTFVCTVTDKSGISSSSAVGVCALNPVAAEGSLYVKNSNGSLTQIS